LAICYNIIEKHKEKIKIKSFISLLLVVLYSTQSDVALLGLEGVPTNGANFTVGAGQVL
jgi:hypothetical protein